MQSLLSPLLNLHLLTLDIIKFVPHRFHVLLFRRLYALGLLLL